MDTTTDYGSVAVSVATVNETCAWEYREIPYTIRVVSADKVAEIELCVEEESVRTTVMAVRNYRCETVLIAECVWEDVVLPVELTISFH